MIETFHKTVLILTVHTFILSILFHFKESLVVTLCTDSITMNGF